MALRVRSPSIAALAAGKVYRAPGRPQGVTATEFRALAAPLQMVVMEAWFRARFQPAPEAPSSQAIVAAEPITLEFGRFAQAQAIALLGGSLARVSSLWEPILDQASGQREDDRDAQLAQVVARLEAVEAPLDKLQPVHGGIGHNNPPDGPLTRDEQAGASAAVAELREEASATRPDSSRAQRAVQILAKVAAAVGRWIWKRAEMATDEAIKKAAQAGAIIIMADVMDAWQKLTALVEAVGRWLSVLGS